METPMTEWNDDRLDELNGRMKEGFAEVDKRFADVDERMKEGFAEVDKRFAEVDKRFEKIDERFEQLNDRFDRIYYLIVMTIVGLAGSLIASNIRA